MKKIIALTVISVILCIVLVVAMFSDGGVDKTNPTTNATNSETIQTENNTVSNTTPTETPTEATKPTEQPGPTEPTEPTQPPKPTDGLTEPSRPTDPTTPSEPTKHPTESTQPTKPDEPDGPQNTDQSKPGEDGTDKDKPAFVKPEKTIVKIGDSNVEITGKSNTTDLFDKLGIEYEKVVNTEGFVKINAYRSHEQEGMAFGAITTLEYDFQENTKFCGVSLMLKDTQDESLSLLGVNCNTTYDDLAAMFGEPSKLDLDVSSVGNLDGVGMDLESIANFEGLYTQTFDVGDDKIMLITIINPETNRVDSVTATFWG